MTLVYRAQKLESLQQPQTGPNVGPGSYKVEGNRRQNSHKCLYSKLKKPEKRQKEKENRIVQEIGPGEYDTDQAHKKFRSRLIVAECQTVFNSKLSRLPEPKQQEIDSSAGKANEDQKIFELMFKKEEKKNDGKLYGIIRDRSKISQSIPSIPNCEQSYGYRIDQATKKLVKNDNPNVLLARRTLLDYEQLNAGTSVGFYNGPGCYFPKDEAKVKGLKWHKPKSFENAEQSKKEEILVNSASLPPNFQSAFIQSECKRWKDQNNSTFAKQQRFVYEKESKKTQLLLSVMSKKFEQYIDENLNMKELLESNPHRLDKNSRNSNDEFSQSKFPKITECFMTKEERFGGGANHNVHKKNSCHEESTNISQTNKSSTQIQTAQNEKQKKMKPFGVGEQRFNSTPQCLINNKLGPGYYQLSNTYNQDEHLNGSTWSRNSQARFRDVGRSLEPGPGHYNLSKMKAIAENNRYNCHSNHAQTISPNSGSARKKQSNFSPQQFCLRKESSHMGNHLKLQSKEGSTQSNITPEKQLLKQISTLINSNNGNKPKYKCEKGSGLSAHNTPSGTTRQKCNYFKQLKKHEIPYHAVERKNDEPGPGHFDIDRQFFKKSYNATYD